MECYASVNKVYNSLKAIFEATLYNVSFERDPAGDTMTVCFTNVTLNDTDRVAFFVMYYTTDNRRGTTFDYVFRTTLVDDELQLSLIHI